MRDLLLILSLWFTPALSFAGGKYTVTPGDTILKICDRAPVRGLNRYQCAARTRLKNPHVKNPSAIQPGDVLAVLKTPRAPASEAAAQPEPPPPPPSPVPVVATVVEEPKPEIKNRSSFTMTSAYGFSGVKVKDRTTGDESTVASDINAGLALRYNLAMGQHTHLVAGAEVNAVHLDNSAADAPSLDHTTQWRKSFALGVNIDLLSSVHLEALAHWQDELFITTPSTNAYDTRLAALPAGSLGLAWDFWHFQRSHLGLRAEVEYLASGEKSDYAFKDGYRYRAALYWMAHGYGLIADWSLRQQDTRATDQDESTMGLGLILSFGGTP